MAKFKFLLIACLAMLVAAPANATQLLYTLTGPGGVLKIKFEIPEAPTPTTSALTGFTLDGVLVSVGPLSGIRTIAFGTLGGLQIRNGGTVVLGLAAPSSPKLFTGGPGNPTMKTGDFTVSGSSGTFSLNVAAVPEPMTWVMLILGFGVVGLLIRARPVREGAMAP